MISERVTMMEDTSQTRATKGLQSAVELPHHPAFCQSKEGERAVHMAQDWQNGEQNSR